MSDTDIFSPLFRWAHRQGENFTTDAFVGVVKVMLKREESLAKRFLGWLCFGNESTFSFCGTLPQIGTQLRSEDGTPDVHVAASGLFSLIEIKKGSDLHAGQLSQYHSLLARRDEPAKSLVLLTAFDATFLPAEKPHHWWRWGQVAEWLERNPPTDEIASWLVREFLTYLKRQVMTIDKVEWQYTEGTKSLYNLTTMLGKALEQAGIPVQARSSAWDDRGHYTKDKLFWTGIYYNEPQLLRFQFEVAKPDVAKLGEHGWALLDRYATTLDLSAESVHFFALTKESQLSLLTTFVKNAHQTATQCIAFTAPPPSPSAAGST